MIILYLKVRLAYEQQEQKALWLSSWRRKEWRTQSEKYYEYPDRRDSCPPAEADRESVRKPGEPDKRFEQQFEITYPRS